jgi:predicted component of type VI protein secretion system
MMIALEVLTGGLRGQRFLLRDASFTIGRAPHNSIVLPDVHLSSEHAQIFREDDKYIFKDLRSTNGSRVQHRDGSLCYVDGSVGFESVLVEGDRLLLGDPLEPVILCCSLGAQALEPLTPLPLPGGSSPTLPAMQLGRSGPTSGKSGPHEPAEPEPSDGEHRVVARRPLAEAEAVAGKVERDPVLAAGLLAVSKRLGRRGLDLQAVFEGIAESVFELLPLATHIAIELTDGSEGKMATVFGTAKKGDAKPEAKPEAKPDPRADKSVEPRPAMPIRASRAVIRRVLQERAAVLIANAPQDLAGAASIMGARIQSIIGVPLWEGDDIRGVIQCDHRSSAAMFRERDLEVLLVLAGQATLAIENARLHQRLRMAEEQLRAENRYLKSREEKRRTIEPIGHSPAFREVLKQVQKVTDTRPRSASRAKPAPARSWSRGSSTPSRVGGTSCLWPRTARRCPIRCSSQSCLGTRRGRLPAPTRTKRACSRWRMAGRCSSMRSARCRWASRRSCCGCCKKGRCDRLARRCSARSMCASCVRPTARWRKKWPRGASGRTSTIG